MWTGQEMTFLDSLSISLVGLLVVFTALVSLAIAIIIISKILGVIFKDGEVKQPAKTTEAAKEQQPGIDEEAYAVILAAVSEEARASGEQVRIISVKEI